jgi:hypothetical protein
MAIKSRIILVVCEECTHIVVGGTQNGRDYMDDRVHERIILKKYSVRMWTGRIRCESVAGSCEHDTEDLSSITEREFH